jgi:GNAT superfamily N-acetyltransferase
MTGSGLQIRFATPHDASTIVRFVQGLAAFEGEPADSVRLTEADVVRDGFGAQPRFEVLLAERGGRPVGLALFFPNYSTWEGRPGLYVEDLFVEESERGSGVGRALMAACARIAVQRGWRRLELAVLDWNPARAFYARLGMRQSQEWLPYRLDPDAVEALAGDARDLVPAPRPPRDDA